MGKRSSYNVKKYWKITNLSEILWKYLKECFFGEIAGPQSATLSKNKLHYKYFFNLNVYLLRTTAYQRKLQKKSKNFEIQCILCYCRCIALHFQLLQLVCLTDQWSTFYKTRMSCLSGQYILSSAMNKKEKETWKVQCRSSKWKVYYIVYEKNMYITLWVWVCWINCFTWWQYARWFICFCAFKIWFVKNSIRIASFLLVL